MLHAVEVPDRRTTTDAVFESLHEDIVSLNLLPGAKLSEAEVARQFGVSRQPVRDAFNRLAHLDLVLVRPQRATVVRGFSEEGIASARFIRLAVELEAIHRACAVWDDRCAAILERNLDRQRKAIETSRYEAFHKLDAEFHKLICELGGCSIATETIEECKRKIDRLCRLGLGREREAATLVEDHARLAHALADRSAEEATKVARQHLSRLDDTILAIQRSHSEYFE
ncbi:MAG: GntR family transcriptional regulator [Devosia sp.]